MGIQRQLDTGHTHTDKSITQAHTATPKRCRKIRTVVVVLVVVVVVVVEVDDVVVLVLVLVVVLVLVLVVLSTHVLHRTGQSRWYSALMLGIAMVQSILAVLVLHF